MKIENLEAARKQKRRRTSHAPMSEEERRKAEVVKLITDNAEPLADDSRPYVLIEVSGKGNVIIINAINIFNSDEESNR